MATEQHEIALRPKWKSYLVAVGATVVVGFVRYLLHGVLGQVSIFLPFVLAVGVAATYGGLFPGLLATALSAATALLFFAPSVFTPATQSFASGIGLALFVLIGLSTSWLCEALHRARRRSESHNVRLKLEVNERAKAEQAERAQREQLRTTLASIGDAVIATDTQGHITVMNAKAESLTGWTASDAKGQPLDRVFRIVHETTRRAVENPVSRVLREGVIARLADPTILIASDGTERPIDDSAAPIRDAAEKVTGVVLIFRDVTTQRRAEQLVQASEARKSAILETAMDCIITIDQEGKVIDFNPAAERTFGYSRGDAIGRELANLIIPMSHRERHRKGLAHYRATGEGPFLGRRLEVSALHANGSEFPVELSITRIQSDGPPLFTAYLRDISERTRADQFRAARLGVTQALNQASDVREGVRQVLRAVSESLAWDVGFFWVWDKNGNELECLQGWHKPELPVAEFEAASASRRFKKGEGLPGRAWATGTPCWILDVTREPDFPRKASAAKYNLHSAFAHPVVVADRLIGVIEFFTQRFREPEDDLLELMGTVAGNVGQFIERVSAEQNLRQSEADLVDFFENATVGLHWVGADGTILRANKAELDMLGYSTEEYVGRNIAEFHADKPVIQDILHRLQSGHRLHEYSARLRCKDGLIKDVLIDSSVLWKNGEFVHTRCFTRDITERRLAEAAQAERSRLTTLRADVGTALAAAQPTQVALQACCEALVRHLGVYFARIWTYNEEQDVLELRASAGQYTLLDGPYSRVKMGEFKIGRIAQGRRPYLTNDLESDPEFNDRAWAAQEGVVAFAGYPLMVERQVVGVLAMFARSPLGDGVLADLAPLAEAVAQYIYRRHAEAGRAEAQRQIVSTLESITDAFMRFDRDWRVTYVNTEAERITQRARGEMLGHSQWELFPDTVGTELEAEYRRAVNEQVTVEFETRHATWGRWFSIKCYPLTDGGLSVYFRDITAKKRAEGRLRESEEHLRGIFSQTIAGIAQTDMTGRFVLVNQRFSDIVGRPAVELTGLRMQDITHPDDLPRNLPLFKAMVDGGPPFVIEKRYIRPDGSHVWVSNSVSLVRDGDGRPKHVAAVVLDITDRRQAEAERQMYVSLAENSAEFIGMTDLQAVPFFVNEAGMRMVGLDSLAEAVQTPGKEFFFPEDQAFIVDEFLPTVQREGHGELEFRFRHFKTGEPIWMICNMFTLKDADGKPSGLATVSRNITERKRAEDGQRLQAERASLLSDVSARLVLRSSDGKRESADDLLESVFSAVARHLDVEYYFNYVVTDEPEMLRLASYMGLESTAAARRRYIRLGEYLCGLVAQTRKPVVVEDLQSCALKNAVFMRGSGVRAYAGYPMLTDGRLIGTIAFFTARRLKFTAEELELIQAVANLLAAAVERDRLSHVARDSADRLRFIMDSMPQKIFAAKPTGDMEYVNPIWTNFTGLSFEQIRDGGWLQFIHPDDVAENIRLWKHSVATGEPFQLEHRFRHADGEYRWHISRALPMRDGTGRVVLWIGSNTDIHDVKLAEQTARFVAEVSAALADLTDQVSTLQKVASTSVPSFADWCAVDVVAAGDRHRRVAVMHADSAKRVAYQRLMEQYPARDDDPHSIAQVIRTGEPDLMEDIPDSLLVALAHDEEHLRLLRAMGLKSHILAPIRSHGKTLGVLTFITAESARRYTLADLRVVQDVAHRVAVAIDNANLYQALQATDRRKDEFLATLAHELRNPLAPIRNGLQIIRQSGNNEAAVGQTSAMMERQLTKMVHLVDDLLDVSRISLGKLKLRKEMIDLAVVVSSAVETSRPVLEANGNQLTVVMPPTPIVLDGDATRLEQVFANLINNAAKYSGKGDPIMLAAQCQDGEIVVRVKDTGIGIPPAMLPNVFDLFMQVDRSLEKSQGGLGVGLTLVKRLVDMHGGSVEALSDGQNKGSEFVVRLPVVATGVREVVSPTGREPAGPSVRRRVLVVDDHVDSMQSLGLLLELLGNEVRTASDGVQAVHVAQAFRPDLILLDIGMPNMNGYDACRRIREQPGGKQTVIVALTGWGQDEDKRRSQEAGFDQHMVKPVDPAVLERLLAAL